MTGEQARAERFAELFRAVYLTFHRRDRPRSELPGASRAVLEHLALAGPLTIGEAAAHMRRAQSLQSFEERFARMAAWQARRDPAASQQDIERQVLDYMATLPAWRDHPKVQAR